MVQPLAPPEPAPVHSVRWESAAQAPLQVRARPEQLALPG